MAIDRGGLHYPVTVEYAGREALEAFKQDVASAKAAWDELRKSFSKGRPKAAVREQGIVDQIKAEQKAIESLDAARAAAARKSLEGLFKPGAAAQSTAETLKNAEAIKQVTAAQKELEKVKTTNRGGTREEADHYRAIQEDIRRNQKALTEYARDADALRAKDAAAIKAKQKELTEYARDAEALRAKDAKEAQAAFKEFQRAQDEKKKIIIALARDKEAAEKAVRKEQEQELKDYLAREEQKAKAAKRLRDEQARELKEAHRQALLDDKARTEQLNRNAARSAASTASGGGGRGGGAGATAAGAAGQTPATQGFFNRLQGQVRQTRTLANELVTTFERLFLRIGILFAIREAFGQFRNFAETIINFNSQIEKSQLGLAALFLALGDIRDATGAVVTPSYGFALAQKEAAKQVALLRVEALKTSSTFENLVKIFQVAVAPGLQAGLDLEGIRKFTVQISQAADALAVPQNQLAEEIRSILSGTINIRNTRLAAALGITNEDIRNAKEQGNLLGFLQDKFVAFTTAAEETVNTFDVILQKLKGSIDQIVGFGGLQFFTTLKDALKELQNNLFKIDFRGELEPNPKALTIIEEMSKGLIGLVEEARTLTREFGFDGLLNGAKAFGEGIRIAGQVVAGAISGLIAGFNDLFTIAQKVRKAIAEMIGRDPFANLNLKSTVASISRILTIFIALKVAAAALPVSFDAVRSGIQIILGLLTTMLTIVTAIGVVPALIAAGFVAILEIVRRTIGYFTGLDIKFVTLFKIIKDGFSSLLAALTEVVVTIFNNLVAVGRAVFNIISVAVNAALVSLATVLLAATKAVSALANALGFKEATKELNNFAALLKGFIGESLKDIGNVPAALAKSWRSAVSSMLTGASQISGIFSRVGKEFNQNLKENATAPGLVDFLSTQAKSAVKGVADFMAGLLEGKSLADLLPDIANSFGQYAEDIRGARQEADKFSQAFIEMSGILTPALESLREQQKVLHDLKEEQEKLTEATIFGIDTIQLQGSVLAQRRNLFEAESKERVLVSKLVQDEKNNQQEINRLLFARVQAELAVSSLGEQNKEILNESLQSFDKFARLKREDEVITSQQLVLSEKLRQATIDKDEFQQTELKAKIFLNNALLAQLREEQDLALEDVDKLLVGQSAETRQKVVEIFKRLQKIQGELVIRDKTAVELAEAKLQIEYRLLRAAADKNTLLAKQAALELQNSNALLKIENINALSLRAVEFAPRATLPEVRTEAEGVNNLRIASQQVTLARSRRAVELASLDTQIQSSLSKIEEIALKREELLLDTDNVKKQEQAKQLLDDITSLQGSVVAQVEQKNELQEQSVQLTIKETAALEHLNRELKHSQDVRQNPFGTGFLDALKEFAAEAPTLYSATLNIMKDSMNAFADEAASAFVDIFDPTKKVDIKARLATFLQEITQQIVSAFIKIAIAQAIASAFKYAFGSFGGGVGGFTDGGAGGTDLAGGFAAEGGLIPNSPFSGPRPAGLPATDTVPLWTSPGEFVLRARAVAAYGSDFIARLNAGLVNPSTLRAAVGMGRIAGRIAPSSRMGLAGGGLVGAGTGTGVASRPSAAYIVANDQAVDTLLAGGSNAMLKFLRDKKGQY